MVRLSLVNTVLPLSSLSTSSIVGIGCLECSIAVLAILISTHFLMSPFCLGMTTIGLTRRWTFHSLSDVHILQFCQLFLYFAVKTVWNMSAWLCYKLCIRLEMQFNGIICQFSNFITEQFLELTLYEIYFRFRYFDCKYSKLHCCFSS